MNTNKLNVKLLATITIMLLFASSMLAMVPSAHAITGTPTASITSGVVGTVTEITATADNYGATVVAYWNEITPENRLNSTRLTGNNLIATLKVTIPASQAGVHSIIVVEELASGGSSTAATGFVDFTVIPRITVTPSQDTRGQLVTISGTGFSRTTTPTVTTANDVSFTFSPTGLGTEPSKIQPSASGSFTTSFRVDDDATDATYNIVALAINGETATTQFTVGPVITLTPNSGASGSLIMISGRGFTPNSKITFSAPSDLTFYKYTVGDIVTDGAGSFTSAEIMITSTPTSTSTLTRTITATDDNTPSKSGSAQFSIPSSSSGIVTTDKISGQPTTDAGPGDTITISGRNFAQIAGTNVTLTLRRSGQADMFLTNVTTTSSGTFEYTFTIPRTNTGAYVIQAKDEYGIIGRCQFFIALNSVGVYNTQGVPVTYALSTGMEIVIKGLSFEVFGASNYVANITLNGQRIGNINLSPTTVATTGVNAFVGVSGSTLAPGTYPVTITAYVTSPAITTSGLETPARNGYVISETTITVKEVANVIVNPEIAPRDSVIQINGTAFAPGSATIRILNATTRAVVTTLTSTTVQANGTFSRTHNIPINFALGDYIINVTDTRGITAETPFTVAKVSINITLGSNTYTQGDIATFQLSSNTAPTGTLYVYDSSGALFTRINLETNKWVRVSSANYVYQQSSDGGVPLGALMQIPTDARTGGWTWNATINDANEPQTYKGTFTVNAKNATPTPTATATATATPTSTVAPTQAPTQSPTQAPTQAPPTHAPTEAPTEAPPEPGGRDWTRVIIIIAVVALIVGVIAVFLFYTMRRKIAN